MSSSVPTRSDALSHPGKGMELPDVRIDAPHVRLREGGARAASPAAEECAAVVATPSSKPPLGTGEGAALAQQVRTQALQLADHLAARQSELDRREAELNTRSAEVEASLEKARGWLGERESDLKRLRDRWIEEHRKEKAELEAARQRLAEEHRRDWADLQEKRRLLDQRAEQVDRASVAIQQVRDEVARVHRETLELRLANEELLAQVAPLVPADVQQRKLQEIRLKLSGEYRRASEELTRKRQELLAIRRDLSEQHRKVTQERDRLHRLAGLAAARGRR